MSTNSIVESSPNKPLNIRVVQKPAPALRFKVVNRAPSPPNRQDLEAELQERLSEKHLKELRASAICDEVILARGYRSVTDPRELEELGFPAYQRLVPGYLLPLHHVANALEVDGKAPAPATFKPDSPRYNDKGKQTKYETPGGFRVCLDVPPGVEKVFNDASIPLCITEGIKKADSAWSHGLACVGLLGTYCFNFPDWDAINLSHRRVYICYDSDVAVKREVADAMKKLTHFLQSKGATVIRLYLPSEGPDKVGLDDYLAQGHTVEELLSCTKRKRTECQLREDLPTIETQNQDLEALVEQSLKALVEQNDPPEVFSSHGRLVRIRLDEHRGRTIPRLETMSKDAVIDRLSQVAYFITVNRDGRRPINPPEVVARMIVSRSSWSGIPEVRRVVSGPVFNFGGEFCGDSGYNARGKIFISTKANVQLPNSISRDDVKRALKSLDTVIQDFPFEDQASKAHCLAFILLPFVRDMIGGPTPLHLFDAPKPGTGKTKLMSVCASIFSAEAGFLENAPDSEDEWRKRLTSSFMEGSTHILLDDVRTLKSNTLQSALSNPLSQWKDRQLSKNENIRADISVVWGVAGNNLSAKAEFLRRCVRIRLNAKMERPETRQGFHIQNLEAYVDQHRRELAVACCTIIQYWVNNGRPEYKGPRNLGSFESWVQCMGGILQLAEVPGFLENQTLMLEQADEESEAYRAFFAEWHRSFGSRWITVKDLVPTARRFFDQFDPSQPETSVRVKLGKFLSKLREDIHGGLMLQMRPGHDANTFRLVPVNTQ